MKLISSHLTVLACLIWIFGGALMIDAHAQGKSAGALSFGVRDVAESRSVDSAVIVMLGPDNRKLDRSPEGAYGLTLPPAARDIRTFTIQLNPGDGYLARDIAIPTIEVLSGRSSNLRFYVTKPVKAITYPYLDRGVQYHNGDYDRAFVYFDAAFTNHPRGNSVTQFDIKLSYNYAMSIANTCLRLHYDTCEKAKTALQGLISDAVPFKIWFDSEHERIDVRQISATLQDVSTAGVNQEYRKFKELSASGNHALAAEKSLALLARFDDEKDSFESARLTKDRLRTDAAVSFVSAARGIDADGDGSSKRNEYLEKAKSTYADISVKTPQVKRDIKFVDSLK